MTMWKILKTVSKGDYHYALVPNHPYSTKNGYVLKHRVVIENHIGRLLLPTEVVHHKNGNKKDNRVENLEVMDLSTHTALHNHMKGISMVELTCPYCKLPFVRERRQTHLVKGGNPSCCSRSCRGKMYH